MVGAELHQADRRWFEGLVKLKHLKGLDARDTQVTLAGLTEFKRALPNCRVVHTLKGRSPTALQRRVINDRVMSAGKR